MAAAIIPARVVSTKFSSPTADIILISNDNYSFAVHKANLARSTVFRDKFEIPPEVPTENDATDDVAEKKGGAAGARKRIRLEKEAEALLEINMEESEALLNFVLPFFYNDEDDYESQPFNGIPIIDMNSSRVSISLIALFFEKYKLRSGKTALVLNLPAITKSHKETLIFDFDTDVHGEGYEEGIWSSIALYLIADHFKSPLCREAALRELYAAQGNRSNHPSDIKADISYTNERCFGSASAASDLLELLTTRNFEVNQKLLSLHRSYIVSDFPVCKGPQELLQKWACLRRVWGSGASRDRYLDEMRSLDGCTCGGCPAQWEEMLTDFRHFLRDLEDPPFVHREEEKQ